MARSAKSASELTRRDLLALFGALGLGTAPFGCSCSDDETPGGPSRSKDAGAGDTGRVDTGTPADAGAHLEAGNPKAVFDDLRALLRTSPDHLEARAADAAKTKDPTKIAEFVRDNITVLPGIGRDDDRALATYSRWGAAATLRAGAGSLRDRANLMVLLLDAAGIPATVKAMDTPAGLTAADLYKPRVLPFSVDLAALRRIFDAAGQGAIANTPLPPDDSADVDAAVSAVLAALGSSVNSLPSADLLVPAQIPVVVPDSATGTAATVLVAVGDQAVAVVDTSTLAAAVDADPSRVDITVSAMMNPPAGGGSPTFVDLVKGSWPLEDVIGHQAQVLFVPAEGSKALLAAPISSFHARVPMIRIQPRPGPDLDKYANSVFPASDGGAPVPDAGRVPPKTNPPFVAIGSTFTIEGEVVTDASGAPNGMLVVLDETTHASAVAKVAKIGGAANAKAFPTVELDLSITDSAGNSVDGLGAGDLVVTEGSTKVPITVAANKSLPHKPRVLISYDASSSTTMSWPSPAARQAFEQALATALTNAAAQHPFDAQVVGLAGAVPESGWAPPTVSGLTAAMEAVLGGSDVWQTFVGPALDGGPAAIIMVSDFDDPDPTYVEQGKERLARSGIPVVTVGVSTVVQAVASEIATLSGGQQISATAPDLTSVVSAIVAKAVAQKTNFSYRVRYDAPTTGGSPRSVTVALATKSTISTTLTYDVPPASARLAPSSVAAVYLTISFAGVTERRRLGGAFVGDYGNARQNVDDPIVVADARSVLDGITTIAIEPASPTFAAVLDDVVLAHQSLGPLRDAWPPTDADAFGRAATKAYRFPGVFAALLSAEPPDASAPIVIPKGLRIAVLEERFRNGTFFRQIDMPPRLNAMRALRGGATDLEAVVRRSLRLSANEALVFDKTAFSDLANRSLVVASSGGLPADVLAKYTNAADAATFTNLSSEYWDVVLLVPTDGGTIAFWAVDPSSGSVTAIDAAGRGGGESSDGSIVSQAIDLILFTLGLGCTLGLVPWPLVCLGLTVASLVMSVAALFTQTNKPQTAFGLLGSAFGGATSLKRPPVLPKGSIGLAVILIILFLIAEES
jgi:hypothetical protein